MSLVRAARGDIPLDLLITNVTLANVLTGEMYPAEIGIWGGRIASVEPPGTQPRRRAGRVLDGRGRIAVPGLVDSHMHIESTLVTPAHFAEAVLPHGTTTVAEDPHELANVMGLEGVRLFWRASRNLPLRVYFLVPTCVPAAAGLETAGGEIGPAEVREMLGWDGVIGLAEVMDAGAVVDEDPRMAAIVAEGRRAGGVLEGHNPMLRGRDLQAYIAAGIDSDHTLAPPEVIVEKLRLGVTVQLQERYLSPELVGALNALPPEALMNVCLVTDDVAPDYLEAYGHLDQVVRTAIQLGMAPTAALRAATVTPARRLHLLDRGCIAPGRAADIVLVGDMASFRVDTVVVGGEVVVEEGRLCWRAAAGDGLDALRGTVHLAPLTPSDFTVPLPLAEGTLHARVITCVPGETRTQAGETQVTVRAGRVVLDGRDNLALITVFERYGRSGGRAFGLVEGLGLRGGAIATTYAHDSHNLAVIGRDVLDMVTAANAVIAAGGGMAVARGGEVKALVELPLAGILSPRPLVEVAAAVRRFTAACADLGVVHPHLLMRLSTFTLPVSSGLRITDRGLVDAERRELVDLWML